MIGNGRFGAAYTADAVNVRPEASFKVFLDQVFSISKRIDWGNSEIVDLVIDPTLCTCSVLALLPIGFKAAFAGPIDIDVFINPTFTPNTPLTTLNRNFPGSAVSPLLWYLRPTVSAPGVQVPSEFRVLSDGTAAVASLGGEAQENLIINIDMTNKYLIRMTNTEASAAKGAFSASWFEIP